MLRDQFCNNDLLQLLYNNKRMHNRGYISEDGELYLLFVIILIGLLYIIVKFISSSGIIGLSEFD